MAPDPVVAPAPDQTISRAAFLGGLLALVCLVALSVIGLGHSRAIEGDANARYWIVVALVAAILGFVTIGLSRTPARSRTGDVARKVGVAAAALWLAVFLWEATAIGSGAFSGPFEIAWSAYKG